MSLFDKIFTSSEPATQEKNNEQQDQSDINYQKGVDFENYVLDLFPEQYFSLIQRSLTYDPFSNRRFEACLNPDFKLRDKSNGSAFWIECKYRSGTAPDGSIDWCTYEKMMKYKDIREKTKTKVYVIIGVQGTPSNPYNLLCFDLDDMKYTKLYRSTCQKTEIDKKQFYSLENLQKRINHSF
ncbi:hypothetical protein [Candidatus Methanomassiliicoccus intestinalis]|uniref:hypothetical protein n=1 Tax=Candidatus Methanomassiliicoccus intestinalis TaxID=1406512 RepID=UPI0037DC21B8